MRIIGLPAPVAALVAITVWPVLMTAASNYLLDILYDLVGLQQLDLPVFILKTGSRLALLYIISLVLSLIVRWKNINREVLDAAAAAGSWKSLNIVIALLLHGRITIKTFRPLKPGNTTPSKSWCTIGDAIILTTDRATKRYHNFMLWNGPLLAFETCLGITYVEAIDVRSRRTSDEWVEMTFSSATSDDSVAAMSLLCHPHANYVMRAEHAADGTTYVYIAHSGGQTTITLTQTVWNTIYEQLNVTKKASTSYTIANLLSTTTSLSVAERLLYAGLIASYWNDHRFNTLVEERAVHRNVLQFVGDRRDDPHAPYKATGRTVGPILVTNPNKMPMKGHQNDLSAIHYRLDSVRNNVAEFESKVWLCMSEFVALLDPTPLTRWTTEQVIENQSKPLQIARNRLAEQAIGWMDAAWKCAVQAMIKVEPVANSGPVRNISTVRPEFNLVYGTYMLPAAEWLKANTKWYTAGKTPGHIATRILDIVEQSRQLASARGTMDVCCADVSKMDAAKHPLLTAHLTTAIYMKMFPDYLNEMHAIREAEATASARTDTGLPYRIGCSQLSGSACTTIDNTITNAFISFLAYRLEGLDQYQSWKRLGVYVGDDSVSLNNPDSIAKAGAMLGYKIVADMVSPGQRIPFLSRQFYGAWEFNESSYQDPLRLLAKIHLSIAPDNIPDDIAFLNKMRGLHELDPTVPLYHLLYYKMVELTGSLGATSTDMPWYISQFDAESWPTDITAGDLWTGETGVTAEQYSKWLSGVSTYDELMRSKPPLAHNEAAPKVPLTVDPSEPGAEAPNRNGPPPASSTVGEISPETKDKMDEVEETARLNIEAVAVAATLQARERSRQERKAKADARQKDQAQKKEARLANTKMPEIGNWRPPGADKKSPPKPPKPAKTPSANKNDPGPDLRTLPKLMAKRLKPHNQTHGKSGGPPSAPIGST
ncbi:RNA dependent RNA polymerase [Orsay virus]|uniref:RNA dependent RNA polymerase n=1 Tax=Orsay virus TaxID=977912 RepID=UPI0003D909A6|nr:RNA dependent RNA polymerase [Orsay virus]ADW54428.2 RNA dependent RNA polymerase [Orsay virus]